MHTQTAYSLTPCYQVVDLSEQPTMCSRRTSLLSSFFYQLSHHMLTHTRTSKRPAFDANHQYAFHPAPLSPQHSSSVSSLHSNCLQSQLVQIICDCTGGKNRVLVGRGVLEVRCINSHFLWALSRLYFNKYTIYTHVNNLTLSCKCDLV